ncbi:MAG: hypothetical protein OSB39_04745 [Opitutales bacterium]|jgi:hypothetical protein|nr:hypothetical protein [Opitutales bacterium]
MNKFKLYLITCLLPLLASSCSYSSSTGWSFSDSDSVKEEKERRRKVDRKTDRILEVGRTTDRAKARRQAKEEVFEDEFFRSSRP